MKKALYISAVLLMLSVSPAFAATSIYDEDLATTATYSATASATPTPTPRTTASVSATSKMPVSGAVENTIMLMVCGTAFMLLGFRFSRE